jgi:hypothetical protein
MTERWKSVVGYEGLYEVSDLGNVRSLNRIVKTVKGQRRFRGKVLKQLVRPDGYHVVALSREGKERPYRVHVLVLGAFSGPRPSGEETLHGNGNRSDNRFVNLRYGTRSENMQDALRHGTHNYAKRTCCDKGHEFCEENTAISRGARICRVCAREYHREYRRTHVLKPRDRRKQRAS